MNKTMKRLHYYSLQHIFQDEMNKFINRSLKAVLLSLFVIAYQVYDSVASRDAMAIFRFLQRRGFIDTKGSTLPQLPPLLRGATQLAAVDMMEAPRPGVVAWRVRPGDEVSAGDVLGEIIDLEDGTGLGRFPLRARTSGVVFCLKSSKLVRPGQIIAKVAGAEPLSWRKGNLLTS